MRFTHLFVFLVEFADLPRVVHLFFFNDTATTEIYTLSLHDALPIFGSSDQALHQGAASRVSRTVGALRMIHDSDHPRAVFFLWMRASHLSPISAVRLTREADRKSTRLNSTHTSISYALFCFKQKTLP